MSHRCVWGLSCRQDATSPSIRVEDVSPWSVEGHRCCSEARPGSLAATAQLCWPLSSTMVVLAPISSPHHMAHLQKTRQQQSLLWFKLNSSPVNDTKEEKQQCRQGRWGCPHWAELLGNLSQVGRWGHTKHKEANAPLSHFSWPPTNSCHWHFSQQLSKVAVLRINGKNCGFCGKNAPIWWMTSASPYVNVFNLFLLRV